ncbi:MAG: hypothetical protein IJ386_01745 [Clostridia bacterium]|nr:hypothetical protein [Clostridia bacterium]
MATWSGIRHKLEKEYLAKSLQGRIQYYCTSYSRSPDHEGRASIRLDGEELISGCYWNNWSKAGLFPHDEKYEERMHREFAYIDEIALKLGVFDQRCFYRAFDEFDNQDIDDSLNSDDLIVRIFAILDRRVGKRRLVKIKDMLNEDDEIFNMFYAIRIDAEKISLE